MNLLELKANFSKNIHDIDAVLQQSFEDITERKNLVWQWDVYQKYSSFRSFMMTEIQQQQQKQKVTEEAENEEISSKILKKAMRNLPWLVASCFKLSIQ